MNALTSIPNGNAWNVVGWASKFGMDNPTLGFK